MNTTPHINQDRKEKNVSGFDRLLKRLAPVFFLTFVLVSVGSTLLLPKTAHAVIPVVPAGALPIVANAVTSVSGAAESMAASVKVAIEENIADLIQKATEIVLNFFAKLLWISGVLLEFVVKFTVVNMADVVNGTPGGPGVAATPGISIVINQAWTIFRDVTNLVFIFIILYLAFQLILGVGSGHWRSLGWLIIMAILINFSLFFTKIVIDASNVLAIIFYAPIQNEAAGGVSDLFMKQVNLASIWNATKPEDTAALFGAAGKQGNNAVLLMLGGTVFIVVTSFVFFAMSLLLMLRFLYLIFLMIFSPLAFACYVIPGLKGYFNKWWSALIHQAFFAPAVFLLMLISFKMLSGLNQTITAFVPPGGAVAARTIGSFFQVLATSTKDSIGVIFNFALTIFFMIYSLILAQKLGAHGAATTVKWGKGLSNRSRAFLGRNLVASPLRAAGESEVVKSVARSAPGIGQLMYGGINKATGSGFGGGKGASLDAVEKKRAERQSKFIEQVTAPPKSYVDRGTALSGTPPIIIKPEDRLRTTERTELEAAERQLGNAPRERGEIQSGREALKREREAYVGKRDRFKANPMKALTDDGEGMTMDEYKAWLLRQESEFATKEADFVNREKAINTSVEVAEKKRTEILKKGEERAKEEMRPDAEVAREKNIEDISYTLGNKFGKRNRDSWKKALGKAEKEMKKKAEQSKSKDKKDKTKTGGSSSSDDVSDKMEELEAKIKEMEEKSEEKKT